MSDNALEAELLPCPFCGSTHIEAEGCQVICNGCDSGTAVEADLSKAIAAWNRRAPLSALPGEAEVVGWAYPQGEKLGVTTNRQTACDAFPGSAKPIPLVTLASLQAMQARAEKAERERDEARNEAWALADQVNEWGAWAEGLTPVEISNGMAKRDARIKALGEALKPFAQIVDNEVLLKPSDPDEAEWHRWDGEVLTVGDFRAARKALQHNGEDTK